MLDNLAAYFSVFPTELATFLLAMVPVGELRLSIPVAVLLYHKPGWEALLWSVLGNMIPVTLILLFSNKFHKWVEGQSGIFFGKTWANFLIKVQKSFSRYQKYELIGLLVFVASSLPGTGSYTGAIVAFILGIPIQKSWPYIFIGVVCSGIVTLMVTLGVGKIF